MLTKFAFSIEHRLQNSKNSSKPKIRWPASCDSTLISPSTSSLRKQLYIAWSYRGALNLLKCNDSLLCSSHVRVMASLL